MGVPPLSSLPEVWQQLGWALPTHGKVQELCHHFPGFSIVYGSVESQRVIMILITRHVLPFAKIPKEPQTPQPSATQRMALVLP